MSFRRATNADASAVLALVEECLAEYGFLPDLKTSESDLLDIEGSYDGSGGLFLVEEENGIVATGGLVLLDGEIGKIRKMYVRQDARGRGLGRAILQRLLAEARRRKVRRVVLETTDAMTVAQRMYEAHGFRQVEGVPTSPRCHRVYRLELGQSID